MALENKNAYVLCDGQYRPATSGEFAKVSDAGDQTSRAQREDAQDPQRAIPQLWSKKVALQHSPGVEQVVKNMKEKCEALSNSIPFLAALAEMISLPQHTGGMLDTANTSPFAWDRKAWSREHFFASVGLALDPGNAVLSATLWRRW